MNIMAEAQRPLQAVVGVAVAVGVCPPFPPSFTIQFPTEMMKHDCISGINYLGHQQADLTQGSAHGHYFHGKQI